jgi:hypothetical protein
MYNTKSITSAIRQGLSSVTDDLERNISEEIEDVLNDVIASHAENIEGTLYYLRAEIREAGLDQLRLGDSGWLLYKKFDEWIELIDELAPQ